MYIQVAWMFSHAKLTALLLLEQENGAHGNETITPGQKSSAKATFASMQTAVALQRQLDVTLLHFRRLSVTHEQ